MEIRMRCPGVVSSEREAEHSKGAGGPYKADSSKELRKVQLCKGKRSALEVAYETRDTSGCLPRPEPMKFSSSERAEE
ncbi:hypothetical protein M413DRAFT_178603 [Hebeloma cylindrosporum]|uniref:Uncharacterized protein n=1 Tax=Hebeloma cylindrosporum TaxID=76867 RepID=A0A0C2XRR0_HEBCY|nr:hypothetical protein M413DRAFT_178603 [Hebeloma cylindrosporum h7]